MCGTRAYEQTAYDVCLSLDNWLSTVQSLVLSQLLFAGLKLHRQYQGYSAHIPQGCRQHHGCKTEAQPPLKWQATAAVTSEAIAFITLALLEPGILPQTPLLCAALAAAMALCTSSLVPAGILPATVPSTGVTISSRFLEVERRGRLSSRWGYKFTSGILAGVPTLELLVSSFHRSKGPG